LDDVIAKHVGHERERPRQDLLKDELLLLGGRHLELLLDEPAPMLVRTAETKESRASEKFERKHLVEDIHRAFLGSHWENAKKRSLTTLLARFGWVQW
jgi:hypothetical protein